MTVETGEQILNMSDEDFLKMPVPSSEAPEEEPQAVVTEQETQTEPAPAPVKEPVVETETETDEEEEESSRQEEEGKGKTDPAPKVETTAKTDAEPKPKTDPVGSKTDVPNKDTSTEAAEPLDYEGLYKSLMAPLKANGKTIEIRSPEELIKLAQQGANYTRKMQELAPHRKLMLMLENNGLLDEGQLSYLIDLNKKDPEAIKKLVKDAGINPLDIDTEAEPAYRQGNHRVTDEEASFRSTLDDLGSFDGGRETLQVISNTWDQASKEMLYKDPNAMTLIHEQRESGIYELISKEVEHQRTLGNVPANVPFIEAYKKVGDWLNGQGAFKDLIAKQAPTQVASPAAKEPVATTVAPVKSKLSNSEKANAAAPSRPASKPAKELVNPLAMSDEDFLKQFENRL